MSDPFDDTIFARPGIAVSRADTARLPLVPQEIEVEISDSEQLATFLEHCAAMIRERGKITVRVG